MKMSRRARRMDRHHKRKKQMVTFSLVSLMDIFTILVFFLLVNSSDVEVLQSNRAVKLPESVAETKPRETLVVMVNDREILIQGRHIASVEEVLKSKEPLIEPLRKELEYHTRKVLQLTGQQALKGNREITIMGDRKIPYRLLKKIMLTCARSHYGNISLAVLNKAEGKG
ncbi:MAG TPA: biopolymer transporter ExbD [Thiotrichales bacterium]|nr:biopolymer transporter ExbD [Thiotrichales bacterium]